jgi:hypothetical protein
METVARLRGLMGMENGAGLSSGFEPDPNDEVNPDWEALDEGKKFKLDPETSLPPTGIRPSGSRRGRSGTRGVSTISNQGALLLLHYSDWS